MYDVEGIFSMQSVFVLYMNEPSGGSSGGIGPGNGSASSQSFASNGPFIPPLNDLAENLIAPGPRDQVVLQRDGLSITNTFITNVQTKLYRGVNMFITTSGGLTHRGVTFSDAINSVNNNCPDHAFTHDDQEKIRLLLAERLIYQGALPYNKIGLHRIKAVTPRFGHQNIDAL